MALTENSKKIIVWSTLIGGIALIGYYAYKYFTKKATPEEEVVVNPDVDPITPTPEVDPISEFTFPFKTVTEGNAFRLWVNTKYPAYAKAEKLDKTGKLNSFVEKAWKKYGADYVKAKPEVVPNDAEQQQKDKYVSKINKETGIEKSKLQYKMLNYLKQWNDSYSSDITYFIFANQVYRKRTGERISLYNPLKKQVKLNNGAYAYKSSSLTSTKTNALGYSEKDEVKAMIYNGTDKILWLYLPDFNYTYRWVKLNDVTRV